MTLDWNLISGSSGTIAGDGSRFTIPVKVNGLDVAPGNTFVYRALTAPGIPKVGDLHPNTSLQQTHPKYICERRDFKAFLNSTSSAIIDLTYLRVDGCKRWVNGNVVNEQTRFSWDGEKLLVKYKKGATGYPSDAVGTNGVMGAVVKLNVLIPHQVLEFERWEQYADSDGQAKWPVSYGGCLNSDTWQTFGERMWVCEDISTADLDEFDELGPTARKWHKRHYRFSTFQPMENIVSKAQDPIALYTAPNTTQPPTDIDPHADGFNTSPGFATQGNGWRQVELAKTQAYANLNLPVVFE